MTVDQDTKKADVDDTEAVIDAADETEEASETSEAAEESSAEENPDAADTADAPAKRRWWHALLRRWFPLTLALALIVSGALAGWLYFSEYRADQQTGEAASQTVLKAATDGTVALLSYAPDSLDQDFSAAKSHLTGDFLSYYNQFTQEIVTPAAKEKSVKTEAKVVRAAVSEVQKDSAVVLVFVNQATTSSQNPNGSFSASAVKVGMSKIDGNWLISKFEPV